MHELTLKTSFEWNLTKEPAFNKTYHIEEVYYICYPSLYGQQYPPLSFFMARVCANTLEGNIKGTHQQHGLGISLHLHSRVFKPPPSQVHHKPFQVQSFEDCSSMLSRAVSMELIMNYHLSLETEAMHHDLKPMLPPHQR